MTDSIVLTGVTSGFGALALDRISAGCDVPIVAGARDPEVIFSRYGSRVDALPLDLESIESVRQFCQSICDRPIGVLGMNAGITSRKATMTQDGFERAFQVNYLSHFLMFQLLQSQLTSDAIVLTTGSGTHDPEEKAPPPAPRHANAEWLAFPERDPNRDRFGPMAAGRAYTASKLCCILMAAEIARRHPTLRAVSFDPAFLPETNLARELPNAIAAVMKRIIPYTMPRDRTGTAASSAAAYAELVTGTLRPPKNGGYMAMRGGEAIAAEPSKLAREAGIGSALWDGSLSLFKQRDITVDLPH